MLFNNLQHFIYSIILVLFVYLQDTTNQKHDFTIITGSKSMLTAVESADHSSDSSDLSLAAATPSSDLSPAAATPSSSHVGGEGSIGDTFSLTSQDPDLDSSSLDTLNRSDTQLKKKKSKKTKVHITNKKNIYSKILT